MKVLYFSSRDMFNYLILIFLCNVFRVQGVTNVTIEKAFENITAGNDLWLGLVRDCKKPTLSCVRNSIYDYLKDTLDYKSDVQFTSFMRFTKNAIDYSKIDAKPVNDTEDDTFEEETPVEEMARSLTYSTRKFFMTHDLEVQLPDTFFLGSTLKVSPRSLDTTGTFVKLEMIPRDLSNSVGEGRIFFKKIRKFISERLLLALLAILLVIKLLAVKILFVLPAIIGVAAAKKLILKVLLFIFPALHHLFKLCAYTPYGAKHHIHKHQISHIHQLGHKQHHPHYGYGGPVEVIAPHSDGPPDLHHFGHKNDPYGEPNDLYPENEFIAHRNDPQAEENEIDPWGQGQTTRRPKPDNRRPHTPTEIENMVLKAEKEALIKSRLQKEKQRIHVENLRLQEQLNKSLKIQEKLKQQAARYGAKLPPGSTKNYFISPPFAPPLLAPPLLAPPPPKAPKVWQTSFAEPPDDGNGVGLPKNTVEAVQNFVTQKLPQNQPQIHPVYQQSQPQQNFIQNYEPPQKQSALSKPFLSSQPFESNQPFETSQPFGANQYFGADQQFEANQPISTVQHSENNQQFGAKQPFVAKEPSPPSKPFEPTQSFDDFGTAESSELGKPFQSFPTFESPKSGKSSYNNDIYNAASITFDPFYSPILEKVDKILNELEFFDEPCRERLICSMYNDPEKFSPHSNLISAELSRDSKELQKPTSTNAAVIRFYKYVQAARDGQDKRDCLRLYPSCVINTES
ncbi:hypothetical protein JTB14_035731 [Gonioctena quinquepunctata]|nr:hypothetical protein JTB14_035731 [Gonioctena quinquepunctata]